MEKRILIIGFIFLFVFSSVGPISISYNVKNPDKIVQSFKSGNTLYVGGSGEGNYTKIQDAIDNASDEDIIFVYNGLYDENVIVTKSIKIIGENKIGTIIDGNEQGHVINITASNVTITGFTIENTSYIGSGFQVYANNSIILNNIIKDFDCGINFQSCSNHIVSENMLTSYKACGINLFHSSNNIITDNTIINTYGGGGIDLYYSSNNTIKGNYVNRGTLWLSHSSNNNTWLNNSIENQGGVYIYAASSYNVVAGNFFRNVTWLHTGIKIENSNNNKIYHNHFINNSQDAYDNSCNSWDNGYPSGGNYWDEYTDNDFNNDGIGDSAYNISGGDNIDNYPMGYFDYKPPIITIISPVEGFLYFRQIKLLPLFNITMFLGKMVFVVNVSDDYLKDVNYLTVYIDSEFFMGIGGIKPYTITITKYYLNHKHINNIFKHKFNIRFEAVDNHKNIASKEMIVWMFL